MDTWLSDTINKAEKKAKKEGKLEKPYQHLLKMECLL